MRIEISVSHKIAALKNPMVYAVCNNSDYVIAFEFDDEWNAFQTKTARFVNANGYTDVIFSGTECAMPTIENSAYVEIGIYAGELHTTTPAYLRMLKSVLSGDGTPVIPTPSVYEQLIALIETKASSTQDEELAGLVWTVAEDGSLTFTSGGGGGGTTDHRQLNHRNDPDQHQIEAVTGLAEALSGKQAVIDDIDTIRAGAAAGEIAYKKPVDGIPVSDLSGAVKESLSLADTALQEHQSLAGYATETYVASVVSAAIAEVDELVGSGVMT